MLFFRTTGGTRFSVQPKDAMAPSPTILALLLCVRSAFCADPTPIDLSQWKLTLPVDSEAEKSGKAAEVQPAQLVKGYRNDPFFQHTADGSLQFWCPVDGATTENTTYPRCELRELVDPTDDKVVWGAAGSHVLDARCTVIEVPSSQKVIIGQIHSYSGKARPLIKLQFFKGRIEALVKKSPTQGGDLKKTFPEVGLGVPLMYQIKLSDGKLQITVNDSAKTIDVYELDPQWAEQTFYFKAGVYPQDNEGPASEGARVSFSELRVQHTR